MQNEAELGRIFDESLNNMVDLEKIIWEMEAMYNQNPTEQMKRAITNLCNNARNQISMLLGMLPKLDSIRNSYRLELENKYDGLLDIQKQISESRQK